MAAVAPPPQAANSPSTSSVVAPRQKTAAAHTTSNNNNNNNSKAAVSPPTPPPSSKRPQSPSPPRPKASSASASPPRLRDDFLFLFSPDEVRVWAEEGEDELEELAKLRRPHGGGGDSEASRDDLIVASALTEGQADLLEEKAALIRETELSLGIGLKEEEAAAKARAAEGTEQAGAVGRKGIVVLDWP